ncbi:putative acid protease protein [Botrytis cinerea BcDW1]|uniref:Putative acid protease protein n=1 Tax=Botryotinia fuckeliana (strain BcDW1) TaxID=1290391 RepID=M7UKD4_BOTF1|nr:putative acid protease protein [Botrytis cinerea BcDW1]
MYISDFRLSTILLLIIHFTSFTVATLPPLHYTITRRGGSFPAPDTANLTFLQSTLADINSRFTNSERILKGNKVVRVPKRWHDGQITNTTNPKPRSGTYIQPGTTLLGEVGKAGSWFTSMKIGEPYQNVDLDLNMLTADFAIVSTPSGKGSFYLEERSGTYSVSNDNDEGKGMNFPGCRCGKDVVGLPLGFDMFAGFKGERYIPVSFAHCRPQKQWVGSLGESGASLGLAVGEGLGQVGGWKGGLLGQIVKSGVVDTDVWSLMLINGYEGVFSVGGSSVEAVRVVEESIKKELKKLEAAEASEFQPENDEWETPNVDELQSGNDKKMDGLGMQSQHDEIKRNSELGLMKRDEFALDDNDLTRKSNDESVWEWSKVRGADGWWEILMKGIWVDGNKVIQNQPIVLDVNTPFIIGPSHLVRSLYSSISGSRQLPPPYDQFHAYPCFNPPHLLLEFGNLRVKVLNGKRDEGSFSPGGRFSLGRMERGSGYCVGIVVEGRFGNMDGQRGTVDNGGVEGNGMEDMWIFGEPFFRDVQVAFDWKEKRVGMQRL